MGYLFKELIVSEMAVVGGTGFNILESREEIGEFALVPPDAGTCRVLTWAAAEE